MLHSDSPMAGLRPTENQQAELVGKGGELSEEQERVQALAGELTMWTAAGVASGKVLTPSCARGKQCCAGRQTVDGGYPVAATGRLVGRVACALSHDFARDTLVTGPCVLEEPAAMHVVRRGTV